MDLLEILFCIGAVYYVIQSILIIWLIHHVVYTKLKYTEIEQSNLSDDYKPFLRFDRKTWNVSTMYIWGVTLLPMRLIGIISFISLFTIVCHTLSFGNYTNFEKELPRWKRNVIKFFANFVSDGILFSLGFYDVREIKKQIKDFDPDYPYQQYKNRKCMHPISISNHISWVDIIYFSSTSYTPSFLSKQDVANYPLWGKSAKGLQCVFFTRENEKDRLGVLDLIKNRANNILNGRIFPPIHIFPEGTTSNGRYIIGFKKGAFEPFMPMKIYCLKYDVRNFSPSLDSIGQACNVLLLLCQWSSGLTVYEFDTYYPDHLNLKKPEDWEIYAQKVKNIMLKCLKVQDSNSGYAKMKVYYQDLLDKNAVLLGKKESKEK